MEHSILDHGIPIGTAIAVFGAAFGMWAWVVGWGVTVIRKEVGELKTQVTKAASEATSKWLEVEHRLTLVEADIRRCSIFSRGE